MQILSIQKRVALCYLLLSCFCLTTLTNQVHAKQNDVEQAKTELMQLEGALRSIQRQIEEHTQSLIQQRHRARKQLIMARKNKRTRRRELDQVKDQIAQIEIKSQFKKNSERNALEKQLAELADKEQLAIIALDQATRELDEMEQAHTTNDLTDDPKLTELKSRETHALGVIAEKRQKIAALEQKPQDSIKKRRPSKASKSSKRKNSAPTLIMISGTTVEDIEAIINLTRLFEGLEHEVHHLKWSDYIAKSRFRENRAQTQQVLLKEISSILENKSPAAKISLFGHAEGGGTALLAANEAAKNETNTIDNLILIDAVGPYQMREYIHFDIPNSCLPNSGAVGIQKPILECIKNAPKRQIDQRIYHFFNFWRTPGINGTTTSGRIVHLSPHYANQQRIYLTEKGQSPAAVDTQMSIKLLKTATNLVMNELLN